MTLLPGTRLGPYEVLAPLGAGGMGEVYRARDTQLKRDVALKVLPAAVATDPERLARFQREAELLAALNHPHIAQIYGVAEADGVRALVMELIDGPTLAERIAQGPVPVAEALPIARQLAEALDEAHERGIVHRDLKPANIKVTPTGILKVLDFGLAKALNAEADADAATRATMTSPAQTQAGIILGTAAYMSPEQARGKVVDKRADIWAFGVVLYEMLTGRRCFDGPSMTDVLAAIVKTEPDWTQLPADVPAHLRRLLARCLTKDHRQRLRDIGEARVELERHDSDTRPEAESAGASESRRQRWAFLIVGVGLGLLAGIAAWWWVSSTAGGKFTRAGSTAEVARTPKRLSMKLAEPLAVVGSAPLSVSRPALAISPDGSRFAYVGERDGRTHLLVRRLDELEARPLDDTDGAYHPFFSPDGQWIGFLTGNQLKKVAVGGGPSMLLCEATNSYGATWADDDMIYFSPQEGSSLSRVPAGGGKSAVVFTPDRAKGLTAQWPHALPGGRVILVVNNWEGGIAAVWPESGRQQALVREGSNPTYNARTRHLVYSRPGALMAIPFDPATVEVAGTPLPVLDQVQTIRDVAHFALAQDGTLVYVPGESADVGRFVWVDPRQGPAADAVPTPVRPDVYGTFSLSPSGRQVVAGVLPAKQLWVFDLASGQPQRLTKVDEGGEHPVWSHQGDRIIFAQGSRSGTLAWTSPDGSGNGVLTATQHQRFPTSLSRDGLLAFMDYPGSTPDVAVLDLKDRQVRSVAATEASEWGAAFSPDGRWLAYTSDETGDYQVWVQSYPNGAIKKQASFTDGGNEEPVWFRDGELYYRNGRRWIAVKVATRPTLTVGPARVLFTGDYINVGGRSYDVAADGRFLLLQHAGPLLHSELVVVTDWHEDLKRLVPTRAR